MIELPVDLLLETSLIGLKEMLTCRRGIAGFNSARINSLMDEWVEARATEMLIQWFILHGEELVATIGTKPQVIEVSAHDAQSEAKPEKKPETHPNIEALPHKYEYWRSERRHARRRRG